MSSTGLYYVDSDGERTPGNCYSVGSGSIFAYGVLDASYRYDLTDKEAYNPGSQATVFEVISVQDCKKPREVEKMKEDKSTSDNKLAAVFERLEKNTKDLFVRLLGRSVPRSQDPAQVLSLLKFIL